MTTIEQLTQIVDRHTGQLARLEDASAADQAKNLEGKLGGAEVGIETLHTELKNFRQETTENFAAVRSDIAEVKTDVAEMKTDVAEMKATLTTILARLPE